MPRYFLQFWNRRDWRAHVADKRLLGRTRLRHSGSDDFGRRGVGRGDRVYVVTRIQGSLFLGGRIQVQSVFSRELAARRFGETNLMEGRQHIVAADEPGPFLPNLALSGAVVERLTLKPALSGLAPRSLEGVAPGYVTAVRGVREITRGSAELLDAVLELAVDADSALLDASPPGLS